MTKIPSVLCHECHQQWGEKIGYFNLVTRAVDDCELKTCKQHSRALSIPNVAHIDSCISQNISSAYTVWVS